VKTRYSMPITKLEDMARNRAWVGRFFSRAEELPISFLLDGKEVRGIPARWQHGCSRRRADANIVETTFYGNDPGSGLEVRVECTAYQDYPVLEWVVWFGNEGEEATPLIAEVRALDGVFEESKAVLVHCNGDFYSEAGYTPEETALHAGEVAAFAPNGGRPCDGAFPYYRLRFAEGGLSIAIGWPGQWAARFRGRAEGVQVEVGQEKTHLRLLPGERIRTPRVTILSWAGDDDRAVNLWRRWYLAHVLPRPDGRPMQPHLACCGTDEGEEFTAATEANQLKYMARFRERGIDFDVWWIDAGWYPCYNEEGERKWWHTGTWAPDRERFPNGLKPVAERAAEGGAALLVWFEPERVRPGTQLDRQHPEWLLHAEGTDNRLLNLGDPACRQWLTDRVCKLIQENGIGIYRQDFNFQPLAHWRGNEAEDRQGMNENLHVQGYLRYWDDLLARNPGLWIDSCSSGGRRNDLETMRRAVPLHYSDYGYGDHPVKLAFHRTLYEWIPYFKEATLSWDLGERERFDQQVDRYSFHCGMAAMLFTTLDIRRDGYDYDLAGEMIAVWRRAADLLLYGDYYPHTPFHRSDREWVAWQFDCPETGQGLVQGIRFPASPQETLTVFPKGVCAEATYRFEEAETGEIRKVTGQDLVKRGFTLALAARSGAIWFYQRV